MSFEESYRSGVPPWDIGRAQPEVVRLLDRGALVGPLIDVGCGTGENSLACAARGVPVRGIDLAPTAVAAARAKATERGLPARFDVADALDLGGLGETFQTVLDCGLFHVFSDEDRPRYVESLRSALRPGGRAFVLCFSTLEPDWGGPRRVSAEEIRAAFDRRLAVRDLQPAQFDTRMGSGAAQAWLVTLERGDR